MRLGTNFLFLCGLLATGCSDSRLNNVGYAVPQTIAVPQASVGSEASTSALAAVANPVAIAEKSFGGGGSILQDGKENERRPPQRYDRVPILGPITNGGPAVALDPPSDEEVMFVFERSEPSARESQRHSDVQPNNVRIVKEKIADYADPPRIVPLIGRSQLHHAHYKCTISRGDSEAVIYIDHNHFHVVGDDGHTVAAMCSRCGR